MAKIIVAICKNRGIGLNNIIPWKLIKDLEFFKKTTMNSTVIMGRKTWDSIPKMYKPLSNRENIIVSRNKKGNRFVSSISDAINLAKNDKIFLIGGENIYKEGFKYANEIIITHIDKNYNCDKFFPLISSNFVLNNYQKMSDIDLNSNEKVKFNILNYKLDSNYIHPEIQYLNNIKKIIEYGNIRTDRTNTGTKGLIGLTMRFDISKHFPLLTTKRTFLKGILHELLWFLRGETDAKILQKKGVRIWDGNTSKEFLEKLGHDREEGDGGPIYGFNFRHYGAKYVDCHTDYTGQGFDQVKYVLDLIKNNPTSRRMIINLWNPTIIDDMVLPPCHMVYQFYVFDGKLSCSMYQRSGDMGLGVPFNIASASLMTYIFARLTNLTPGELVHTVGDAHIYLNHLSELEKQIKREPTPLPIIEINPDKNFKKVEDFEYEDFNLIGYIPHNSIKMKMAV